MKKTFWLYYGQRLITSVRAYSKNDAIPTALANYDAAPGVFQGISRGMIYFATVKE